MSRKLFRLIVVTLLLASCTGSNTLKIKETNFDGQIDRFQNLVFTFNKDLVADSLLNRWDTLSYLTFEPAVKGKFRWTSKRELTFSPAGPFAYSTDYKAIPGNYLVHHSAKKYTVDKEAVKFHTAYLALDNAEAYWALASGEGSQVEVRVQLLFNSPVSPSVIKDFIRIKTADGELAYSVISKEQSPTIELSFQPPQSTGDEAINGTITINKGLECVGSSYTTPDAIQKSFIIPSRDKLAISDIFTEFREGKGIINVLTTQPVIGENISQYFTTEPSLRTEIEILDNGFCLKGAFLENETYTIKVSGKLKGVFGKEMGEDYQQSVSFGQLEPYVAFADKKGMYLSARGERNLGVNIINIPRVKISVFKIFENNIQAYMRNGQNYDYCYEDNEYYDIYGYPFSEDYGRAVMSREVDTRSLPKSGNIRLLNLNLEELNFNESYKGFYLVKVESVDKRWLQDVLLVSLSDLGIIVKQGKEDVFVFVNSLKDASPLQGAKVELVSSNNQKVMSALTDNKGVAVFKEARKSASGFTIAMISARLANDFNFILFNNSQVETSRFDVGGKYLGNMDYDVFIYGDRELYRPGDSVFINTLVRTTRWQTVADIPVKVKILGPNGKEYKSFRKQLNNSGAAETRFVLPAAAMTGTYLIEVYSGNDILLNTRRISVEEFMPDRVKVNVKTNKSEYRQGEPVKVDLEALNLFGPPAVDRNYEVELRLSMKNFKPIKFPDYSFNINAKFFAKQELRQGKTDAAGKGTQSIVLPEFKNFGILDGRIFSTVFDETGRPVNRLSQVDVITQDVFFGIKNFDSWVSTRKPLSLCFAAVNKAGNLVNGAKARVVIKYFNYENVVERNSNRYNYISQRRETQVFTRDIIVNGAGGVVSFKPARSGEYEVRVMLPGAENYVAAQFYAYGWSDTDYSSFEINREGEISISTDKNGYQPGETAHLLFKSPFDGSMLITFEQEDVLEYRFLQIKDKAASLDIKIKDEFLPNIYVSATAFKKISDNELPLTVAHGYQSLKVDNPGNRLPVTIKSPEKCRSKSKQQITIKTTPNTELTVAVVDEGILQVTDYKTPDPYAYYYSKRALGVSAYDVYRQLFPELSLRSSSFAGGSPFDMERRINPITSKRVKLVSLWSGQCRTNASGEYTFKIDVPQFSGALRVMAAAYKDKRFGGSEKLIHVSDPVTLSTSLPRFLSPGDKSDVPVTITNTTGKQADVSVELVVKGTVKAVGRTTQQVKIPANSEKHVEFNIEATQAVGQADIKVIAKGFGETFTELTQVPVRPPSGLVRFTGAGSVKAGSSKSVKLNSGMFPAGVQSRLLLSKSPIAEFTGTLNSLIRYPYGCMEQTVSAAFPQIYLADLMKAMNVYPGDYSDAKTEMNPRYNVQEAIQKVEVFQQYNGGLSIWPTGGEVNWWTSAYAAHFLYEADKAGYNVNQRTLQNLYKYLEQKVKEKETATWYYYENNVLKSRVIPRQEIMYSLYVLTLAGRQNIPLMNYYRSRFNELNTESQYLLAAAFMQAGDRLAYRQLLPSKVGTELPVNTFGGCFDSYIRERALILYALIDTDPDNPQIGIMVNMLSAEFRKQSWYSTQENAFGLLALGRFASMASKTDINADVKVNGKISGQFNNKDLVINTNLNNTDLEIVAKGSGNLFYFYEISGIKSSGLRRDEDNFLEVRKKFYDRNGRALSGNSFIQNDMVVVEITLRTKESSAVENVAVTDLLPACFEIENSRLNTERKAEWMKAGSTPDYTDIRDDRISFFTTATATTKKFYYTIRVVGKGEFVMGPVSADAMYNGQYHSYSGSAKISVK